MAACMKRTHVRLRSHVENACMDEEFIMKGLLSWVQVSLPPSCPLDASEDNVS